MKQLIGLAFLLSVLDAATQPVFQLAPPLLQYRSGFFTGSTTLAATFNQPGASIHYSVNGKEPTEQDPVYAAPIIIRSRSTVKLKAFGKDYRPSETVTATFIRDGRGIKRINYSKPNDSYIKSAPTILHDNMGGLVNYRSGGWLGYDNDTVVMEIELEKKQAVKSILVDLLQDENSWIFLPEKIEILAMDEKTNAFRQVDTRTFSHAAPGPKQCVPVEIPVNKKLLTARLKIILYPLKQIPDWHSGKGKHGWLFIDEIKVY